MPSAPFPGRTRGRRPARIRAAACAALVVALAAAPAPAGERGVYTLFKDGNAHSIEMLTRDGQEFLSLPDLVRALGGSLRQDAATRGAHIEIGDNRVEVGAESSVASVNGAELPFSRPPLLVVGTLYVPPDFVTRVMAAALSRVVRWKDRAESWQAQAGSLLAPAAAEPPSRRVRSAVEVRSLRDYTRVLVTFHGASVLPYTVHAPGGRVVLRVQGDEVVPDEPAIEVGDGAVVRVVADRAAGRPTVTLELGPDFRSYQTAVLREPFRVVFDVFRNTPYDGPPVRVAPRVAARGAPDPDAGAAREPAAPAGRDLLAAEPSAVAVAAAAPSELEAVTRAPAPAAIGADAVQAALRPGGAIRTIVIDPGHGGGEPGARGPGNLLEKEVTLDVAKRTAALLERNLGVRVVLTRSSDVDLSLDERTGIANHEKADLFVSIHANASLRGNARGAESYFLARHATDDESRKLAALENRAVGEARGYEGTDLELILWNLAQNEYLKESQTLAETIQRQLNELLDVRDRGVKQAPFKVLVGATMPAVLVEVGFISNPAEEKLLRQDSYRDSLAEALYRSIVDFKRSRDVKMGALAPRAE